MQFQRRHRTLILFLGVFSLTVLGAAVPGVADASRRYVRVPASEKIRMAALNLQPSRTIDYGGFVWIELSPEESDRLRESGVAQYEEPDAFVLRLGERSFDPLELATMDIPGAPATAARAEEATEPDLHLVQLVGPTKAEWLDDIRSQDLEIVQYIHPYTYIVWGSGGGLNAAADRPQVRWAGAFEPAYRLLPKHRNLPDQPDNVRVLMYRGADTDAVVDGVRKLGGELEDRRKLNNVFELAGFTLSTARLEEVSRLTGVYSVQVVPKDGGLRGEMSNQVCVNNVDGSNLAFPGYESWLASVGLSGAGVIIANVDSGVQNDHPDLVNRLISCSGTTCGGGTTSYHGTHTAGIMAADGSSGTLDSNGFLRGLGVAPAANLVEQVYSPYFTWTGGMSLLMYDSYNNGASLSGNSWGPSGSPQGYDNDTMQVDIGVRDADPNTPGNQPLTYVLSFMNGYGGISSQGTPDEAKNVFTIGSTKMQNDNGSQILDIDDLSANSAHGPALDNRKIPHMVAPGCEVDSTGSTNTYGTSCGTSMASPHVSGAVALFIEYYRGLPGFVADPSPAMVKAAFLPVARGLAGNRDADGGTLGHPYDSKQGWGRMDVEAVVDPQLTVQYFDNPVVFDNTGEEWNISLAADDPNQPVRIMLVWTDAYGHGLGGSTPAWNNNLDLIVEVGGDTYRGNTFDGNGWSTTGGSHDPANNTEGIFLGPNGPASYTVRVVASDINSDGIPASGDITDQDFALVCYNSVPGGPRPPTVSGANFDMSVNQTLPIALQASDDGLPDPPGAMTYIITSLPTNGELSDPGAGVIGVVPYTIAGGGNQLDYTPTPWYVGPDSFTFKADDGGVPPDAGESIEATILIRVANDATAVAYEFNMDTDPGWTTTGDWAWGQPTGQGGEHGGPDPTSGYTGDNVYGYNLDGDYPLNMPVYNLTTTALDCSILTDTTLKFWRWLGVEQPAYDHASIQVSNDGSSWTTIWENTATIEETSWSQQEYDISAIADGQATVYVRWTMGTSDGSWVYCGWNIDDVQIVAAAPFPQILGDLDFDCDVDLSDLAQLLANYGATSGATYADGDIDADGDVDLSDLAELLSAYGESCP